MIVFYFAWVDETDTVFDQSFARNDENILSLAYEQQEGDFASLKIEVKNTIEDGVAVGLLSPGRKQHAWISYDDGETGDARPWLFCRIVGVPTSILRAVVELEFDARPADLNAQKAAVADSLRELPWYDEIFIDEQHRNDPDVVLEARSAVWHFDPITHEVTISDILVGEEGVVEFQASEMLFDGLELELGTQPLSSVTVSATLPWTQLAKGSVDLTEYLIDNWPNEESYPHAITSYTMTPDSWPKTGSSIGDGWTVVFGECTERYDLTVKSQHLATKVKINWPDGESTTADASKDDQFLQVLPPGSIYLGSITTTDTVAISRSGPVTDSTSEITSFNRTRAWTDGYVPLHHLNTRLIVSYDAQRPFTENVSLTLVADVQPIVTMPSDDEPETIALSAVNLSEPLDEEATDFNIPIVDPSRRSYITTERGHRSLEYMILRARAQLLMRSRAVTIGFMPYARTVEELDKIVGLSLRHSALIHDWRIPGGEASGKVTSKSIALNGDSGVIECSVRIGCPIGNGGTATVVAGAGLYVDAAAMGPDLQEFTGRTVLIDTDTSVGYSPPMFAPDDDGIEFSSVLTAADIIEQELTVENPPATQRASIEAALEQWRQGITPTLAGTPEERDTIAQQTLSHRSQAVSDALEAVATTARFQLKSMKREFDPAYQIAVTDLKIPTGIDLGGL